MKTKHIQYLIDTINGVSITTQAQRRKVSGSSQSSMLKTAMKTLLQQSAVRRNKQNYDIIAHDKKVQHLNRHRAYWEIAVTDYINSQPKVLKNEQDAKLVTRYRNGLVYQGNKVIGTYDSDNVLPTPQRDTDKSSNANTKKTAARKTRQPVETIFYADTIEQAFDVVSEKSLPLSAYDGALLMYNTIVKLHNLEY